MLTNAVDLARELRSEKQVYPRFELTGQLISPRLIAGHAAVIRDKTGCIPVVFAGEQSRRLAPGDHVKCFGSVSSSGMGLKFLFVVESTVLAHGTVPPPLEVTPSDIYSGKCEYAIVRLSGTVVDVFQDEANARYSFVVLSVNGSPISMPTTTIPLERLNPLVGATVSIVGRCSSYLGFGPRAKLEYEVYIDDESDITVLAPAPKDPFDVPAFEDNVYSVIRPKPGDSLRRKITGRVEALSQGNRIQLRTAKGEISTIELLSQGIPPELGAVIDAVGIAETDFFRLNLTRAVWRPSAESVPDFSAEPIETSLHALYFDEDGHSRFDAELNGRLVRIEGTVYDLSRKPEGGGTVHLHSGDDSILIDATAVTGALDGLETDCRVSVTGLCLAETENWRLRSPFPHIRGMSIVTRSRDDIRVLARPPWWTPAKLRRAILLLLLAIVLLVAYSSILTRVIRRRTEELDRERRERERADIKKIERTRLAIDLHDSLAQSINGCTMEVEAALEIGGEDAPAMISRLERTRRSLQSCREELRNSIWDLRSDALEEPKLDGAILRTLTPLVNKTRLAIKFAVPRACLSDHTCHAVLKIVRELTLNALHHGKASLVQIAGKLEGTTLLFSVTDNGCGFDVDNRPGVLEGHFGLQGVKERVKSLGGEFVLTSKPGSGAKARVSVPIDPATI